MKYRKRVKKNVVIDKDFILQCRKNFSPGQNNDVTNEESFLVRVLEKINNNNAITGQCIQGTILPEKANMEFFSGGDSTVVFFVVGKSVFI